jgi:uncharacterized protein YdhG (YjbR/CyaY superfamily)
MKMHKKQTKTIDDYIDTFPLNVQRKLRELRRTIRKAAPKAEETISYQIPAFKLNGNLVYFAAFKNHIGLYPTTSAMRAFKKELSKYETSKGTVRFPMNKPIPLGSVERIVRYRVRENSEKRRKK